MSRPDPFPAHYHMIRIAGMEQRHADFWKGMLEAHQEPLPEVRVNRVRLLILRFLRLFINPVLLVSLLELCETSAGLSYGFGTLMRSVFGLGVEGEWSRGTTVPGERVASQSRRSMAYTTLSTKRS